MPALPLRVLVVEDEVIVAMSLEDMLGELDCTVVGPATNLAEALALARSAQFDVALLDVNLNGDHSRPVAEALQERAIPFALITGYGSSVTGFGSDSTPVLSKPCSAAALKALLDHFATL